MKTMNFIIFFSVFFTIYGAINYYIFIRGWQALPVHSNIRIIYLIVFLFISLSFIAGRILERIFLNSFTDILVWVGSFWLAYMLYLLLFVIGLDLLRLVNHFFPFFKYFYSDYAKAKLVMLYSVVGLSTLIILIGHINSVYPGIKNLTIKINKPAAVDSLTIAVASDIHLGTIINQRRFGRIVDKINSINPDVVLFPGDIVDEDLGPVIKENLGEALLRIKSLYGVLAVTGNHEFIGGVEPATKYLREHGVTVLRDSVLEIAGVQFVGREDRNITQFTGKHRKSIRDLLAAANSQRPVILMDHQPFNLNEAVENNVDLQLSGHTHHGQLWPLNYITEAIYEVSWGYKKIGSTHFYVSCGAGTWGPQARLGNRPEVLNIKVRFGK